MCQLIHQLSEIFKPILKNGTIFLDKYHGNQSQSKLSITMARPVHFTEILLLVAVNLCHAQEVIMMAAPATSTNTFVKLDVPAKYLKGARWEIDTKYPKQIFHSVEITDISRINVDTGEFRLDLNLRQRWTEENLIFPTGLFLDNESDDEHVTADSGVLAALWVPDLYFPSARSSVIEGLETRHANVLIFKNKTIMYYATMTTTLGCPMEFQWYPLDIQLCRFDIESYTYTINKVMFEWENITTPVIIPNDLDPRRYALNRPLRRYNGVHNRFGRADSYSRITIMFVFERELSQNLIQVYIPTFLIVSLSWFSFWIGLDAIPGRVGLLVTCMLTLVTMYTGLKVDIPPVEYIKILDIWMACCLLFNFAAMAEFVVVRTISHTHKARNEQQSNSHNQHQHQGHRNEVKSPIPTILVNSEKLEPGILPYNEYYSREIPVQRVSRHSQRNHPSNVGGRVAWDIPPSYHDLRSESEVEAQVGSASPQHHHPRKQNKSGRKRHNRPKALWEKIDISSRITFPLLFLCFCLVYWPILIFGSQTQKLTSYRRY